MAYKDIHLIKVDGNANNNKFYDMHDNGNGTFTVTYGRIGGSSKTMSYPISKWDEKYREKTGPSKGYTDHSSDSLKVSEYKPENDTQINDILQHFLEISRQYVSKFTSTNCLNATAITKVQELIDKLTNIKSLKCGSENYKIYLQNTNKSDTTSTQTIFNQKVLKEFNDVLVQIFAILPRKMKKVEDGFLVANVINDNSNSAIDKIIVREQTLLDNIKVQSVAAPTGTQTIQEAFGFNFTKASPEETEFIKNKFLQDCQGESISKHIVNVYKVCNPTRNAEFEEYLDNNNLGADSKDNKNIKLYWHGTGPENILSIMSNGLIIRPSNVSYAGSAFGEGIYNAPSPLKANSYTSIDKSRGGFAYMLVNAVIVGTPFDCSTNGEKIGKIRICDLNGNNFSQLNLNYHSVHAHASSNSFIRRDEVIVYNSSQVATRYLVELC